MSALWQLAWMGGDDDARNDFRELAREGEALLVALGGAAPDPGATSLPTGRLDGRERFGAWTDAYNATVERAYAMPLSVLFAGVSGWDPRGDALVQRLTTAAADEWPVIVERLRARGASAAVQASADWFRSRAVGLASGNELQTLQLRVQRSWWSAFSSALPVPTSTRPNPTSSPAVEPSSRPGGFGRAVAFAVVSFLPLLAMRRRGRR